MAGMKQLGMKTPKPKTKSTALKFGRPPKLPTLKSTSYKKLENDPMKFGNFGYDTNMSSPSIIARGKRVV